MIHIILDKKNGKGLVNITGELDEVRCDFANLFEKLYEAAPDMFMDMVNVLTICTEHIKEEELKKHDQNNTGN